MTFVAYKLVYSSGKNGIGHRIFTNELGQVVIGDWSGVTPQQTDDGPLYPNAVVPLELFLYDGSDGMSLQIVCTCTTRHDGLAKVWLDVDTFRALRVIMPHLIVKADGALRGIIRDAVELLM
jgi:hypothetical protein